MKIIPRISLEKIKFNEDTDLHLVVNLTAPVVNWQDSRIPICLMLVVDISGSMKEGGKLHQAKISARKIIDHLKDTDYCGIAVFSDEASLISSPLLMTEEKKNMLKEQVEKLATQGMTNFSHGLEIGLSEVNKQELPEKMLVRVIMLTDGVANMGISTPPEMLNLLSEKLGRATCSAFGYGADAAQEFLMSFARKGRGNYAFIKDASEALGTFAKELGGLLSMYARDITIAVTSSQENMKFEVVSDVPAEKKDGKISINLSDIIGEEERNVIFKCKVPALSQADELVEAVRKQLADVSVSYELLNSDGSTEIVSHSFSAEIDFVNVGDEQKEVVSDLNEIIGRAQLVRAQLDAEKQANDGDYEGAAKIMTGIAGDLRVRGLEKLSATSEKMALKVATGRAYAASAGYRSSTSSLGTRGVGTSGADAEAAADIILTNESMTNATQDSLIEAFTSTNDSGSSK